MSKDYYDILGVSRDASQEDVKRAFHKLAHKHHPHKGGDEKKFKEINEAYQVLSDKEKRQQYDQFGSNFESSGFSQGPFSWGGEEANFDFGDLGDIFSQAFGFGQARRKDTKRGKDIEVDIEITLNEVLTGVKKTISLLKQNKCQKCDGKGAEPGSKIKECSVCGGAGQVQRVRRTFFGSFNHAVICSECNGEGKIPEKICHVCKGEGRVRIEETIDIDIPAGIDTNQTIKIQERGEAGKKGGKAGNLYVRILVKPHSLFQRKGDDLYISLPISFSQAVLGGEVDVPSLDGKDIILTIPEGIESGRVLRITGKGVSHISGFGKGNMFVELIIKTPQKLSRKQRELFEELKKQGL